ncbi:hypothetical protein ACRALDRAFT_2025554 [Sodiomyces alcalophilus JCM 7366]|uniref:uncharacterized protein n=1 Tax=Sodiomyces alcalophilus JCM 7366 TaxID=591952 RepID=UPI0039B3931E
MKYFDHDPSTFVTSSLQHHEYYSSSLESTATASVSVWSAVSSQSSTDTSPYTISSDSEPCDSYPTARPYISCDQTARFTSPWGKQTGRLAPAPVPAPAVHAPVPAELRQNPRRSNASAARQPPALTRHNDRKVNFVGSLVDSSTQIVEAIWPLSSVVCRNDVGTRTVLPLRTFIQETLRRSRTSYSTLQVALYYLILIKPHVPKHDFTMEQPDDKHEYRALQCGRRMFLAALILASKYLQDRNYSSRAWSKISGLPVQEINQNELAFLLAVNWEMHITDDVFQRWTDIVLKYTPPSPPPPGAPSALYAQQCDNWKKVILILNSRLDNIDALVPGSPTRARARELPALSPRSLSSARQDVRDPFRLGSGAVEMTQTPSPSYFTPSTMEPVPCTVYPAGRQVPALGLLPTPRLTPQSTGYSTPAANAATHFVPKGSSAMGLAMAQASNVSAAQTMDRWSGPIVSSPQGHVPVRRSSLATSVSTTSSPESMVSDSSHTSRSSSISSASSLASAPPHKLGVSARFRCAKLGGERLTVRSTITSVPEDYQENCFTSSPESYTGPVGKLGDLSLLTPLGRRERELDEMGYEAAASDAARALQALQSYQYSTAATPTATMPRKRSRESLESTSLQENVRQILSQPQSAWPETLVRSRPTLTPSLGGERGSPRKRVCCSTGPVDGFGASGFHHSSYSGYRGPGMWAGILN